jgi:hypothetical protein
MKKILPALLFISSSVFGQSNFLYNLYIGYDPYANKSYSGNAVYNASTTDWTITNAWSDSDIHAFGDHTIDPVNKRWYQVYGDSLNMYLLMIDMITGDTLKQVFIVDSVGSGAVGTVTIGGNINGTFYNCLDNCVYFMHYKAPFEDSTHLAKVNVSNYEVTEIATFPISYYSIDNSAYPFNQTMYMLYYDYYGGISNVLSYLLQSNSLSSVPISLPNFNAGELELTYGYNDGKLYGIDYDLDSFSYNNYLGTVKGVQLDPLTGQLTFLTPGYYANIIGSNVSFYSSSSGDKVYFIAQNSNPSYYEVLGTFDLALNTISFDTVAYTNSPYGSPTPFGSDLFNLSKGCPLATEVDNPAETGECNFDLLPDPGSGEILIQSTCDLSQYHALHLRVFDILGRKVLDDAIHGSDVGIKMKFTAGAAYVYHLLDGNQSLHSGKFLIAQ